MVQTLWFHRRSIEATVCQLQKLADKVLAGTADAWLDCRWNDASKV